MRIKTITCHDVYNVGASLQAYALVTYLKELGHDVEIIDYKPDYLSNHYPLLGLNNSKFDKPVLREIYQLVKLPNRIKARCSRRKKEFDRFKSEYLPITKQRYFSNEDMKKKPPVADVFFAGSDQIWNTVFENGKDPAFYLDFAPASTVKASYAASFSTSDIDEKWKKQIEVWLNRLDYISVRESSGVEIIERLGIKNSVRVLDPVFLIDAEYWRNIEYDMALLEPYLLVYDFDQNSLIADSAVILAKKKGLKIYSIFPCDYCDRCFEQEGPRGFLYLVRNAEFVLSNSFHATAFSIIFKKKFIVFERNEKINTRMYDLLKLVDMEKCFCLSLDEINEDEYIDYSLVHVKLNYHIKESKEYIKCVLGKVRM